MKGLRRDTWDNLGPESPALCRQVLAPMGCLPMMYMLGSRGGVQLKLLWKVLGVYFKSSVRVKCFLFKSNTLSKHLFIKPELVSLTSFQKPKENQNGNRCASGQHSPPSHPQVPFLAEAPACVLSSRAMQVSGRERGYILLSKLPWFLADGYVKIGFG